MPEQQMKSKPKIGQETYEVIELTDRMITSVDPTQLGKGQMRSVVNMRYTDAPGIKGVQGMSKINTTPIGYPNITASFNYIKTQPAEQHFIVQAWNSAMTASGLFDCTTAAPNQGSFTQIFTESAGAGIGSFTLAPNGVFAYANGVDTLLWSGVEDPVAAFVVANTNTVNPTIAYDYSIEASQFGDVLFSTISQRYIMIGCTRMLQGFKMYVNPAKPNTAASTMAVYYWSGSAWTAVSSITDGTAVSGKTLVQTGSVSFTSTVGLAQPKYYNYELLYWYLIDTGGSVVNTTEIFTCTVNTPIQSITDFWDGSPRLLVAAYAGGIGDVTTEIYQQDYVPSVTTTYLDLTSFGSNLLLGFTERQTGLYFGLVPSTGNITSLTIIVQYWNGSAWTNVTSLTDNTAVSGESFDQAGTVIWTPPSLQSEFMYAGGGLASLYYYNITWSNTLSSNPCYLDYVTGIPTPNTQLGSYKSVCMFQQRLCLINQTNSKRNTIQISASGTNCVFNGDDSIIQPFGDDNDVDSASPFFSRFSNAFFENLLVMKADSIWVLDGTATPATASSTSGATPYQVYNVANSYGSVAPNTLITCDIGFAQSGGTGATRNVTIWQTANNIMLWDGSVLYPVSQDIADVFDQTNSYAINPTMVSKSQAFYDEKLREYHWLWASGTSTTLNMEYVFDLLRHKWFTFSRGAGNQLQCGCSVQDANGEKYCYAGLSTGYVERLENGTTFDGQPITSGFWTGDIPFVGWFMRTLVRWFKLITKSKNVTSNQVQIQVYRECENIPSLTVNCPVADTKHRIVSGNTQSLKAQDAMFHSFQVSMTQSSENIGFEPIGISLMHVPTRYELE